MSGSTSFLTDGAAVSFTDSLANLVTGLGTSRDKNHHSHFVMRPMLRHELDAAYFGDWLAGKIIDAPPDDMTREWRTWAGGPRNVGQMHNTEARLGVRHKVNRVMKMARLYGGAALLIGDGDPNPAKPLDPGRIKRSGIKYLHCLSRWEIFASALCRNPISEWYGEPEHYTLATPEQAGFNIHPSRVVRFHGVPWLEIEHTIDGWGYSILDRVRDAVRDVAVAQSNLAHMTHEAKVDVIQIKGLNQNVASADYRDRLQRRFSLANQIKSVMGALLLDGDEVWSQKTVDLKGVPEAGRFFLELAAGGADIPATRLLSTPPKGMDATGESDTRNYYDGLAAKQETEVRPALHRLDMCLKADAGVAGNVDYWWNPLWQLSDNEKASIALQNAQTDQIYATMGVTGPTILRRGIVNRLLAAQTYPGLQEAIDDNPDEEPAPLIEKAEVTANEIDAPSPKSTVAKADRALTLVDGKPTQLAFSDATPRSLNVSRRVLNPRAILAWARGQGFATTMIGSELHVTVMYSEAPVDWMAAGSDSTRVMIPAGGPRVVERFGKAVVLLFSSYELAWRHDALRDIGAVPKHAEYQPHVTLTWQGDDLDLAKITPYPGRIVLGPERFAEVLHDQPAPVERAP